MPQPGYTTEGKPTGRIDSSGRYIPNRPLTSRLPGWLGGVRSAAPMAPAMAAAPRNPADIAPPGYTQAEWDAMGRTSPVTVTGSPVGGGTGAEGNFTPYGGPGYDNRAVQNAASRLAQSPWGSDFPSQGGMTGPTQSDMPGHIMYTDEGGPVFATPSTPALLRRGHARSMAGRGAVQQQIAQLRSPAAVAAYRSRAPKLLRQSGGGG